MVKVLDVPVRVKAAIQANTKAGGTTPLQFEIDPRIGFQYSINIPKGEYWVLVDAWIESSQTPDGKAILFRNDTDVVVRTPNINTMDVSNNSRPRIGKVLFKEFDKITGVFINAADVGTAGATVYFHLLFKRVTD
ncbi:MAG TPA: hypothetical protein ENG46_01410 [Acidilobales archaeon]|nr:hypothetical protein [Acidilobales archaeon]